MKIKTQCQIALFIIWIIIMLPIVEAQSMSFQGAGGDTTPPAISTVQLTHGPQTVITWTTDEASNSKAEFGTATTLDQVTNKPDLETAHSLTIQTTPSSTYYYRITSCDAASNCKSTPVQNFVAGPFYIQATVPRYAKSTKLDIPGSTRPGATVSVIVNGAEVRKDEITDGEFLFKNVQLLKAANTIKLKSTLGAENAEANYQVDVDDQPPIINVTLPKVVTSATATAKVKVSEPVNLTVELAKPTGTKPLRPTDLKEGKIEAGRIELSWKTETPAPEYGIYRNGKRIATTPTAQYTDTTVGAGKQYQYQVSAATDKCIESDLSDILTVQTPAGQNTEQPVQEKQFTCEKPKQSFALEAGQKDVNVPLQEGENFVTFTAVDRAGYKSIAEERILYDTGPPKFENTNLKQLTPTYSQDITVNGKLSERGSVTAFVNGKPQKTEPTAEDGSFSIKVKLERSVNYTSEQTRSTLDTGISWKSKVKLEAIDAAGLKTTSDEVQIEYALCGSGTWLDVKLTDPMPDILNPRLLIEGIQQLGIAFNYEYKGTANAVINPRDIRIKKLNLAPEFQKEYDNGLVTTYTPPVRAQRNKKPSGAGYIQINFLSIDDPWALQEKNKDPKEKAPLNATMLNKEDRISTHREGDCLAPGLGCMRLFLELEIPFQEETEYLGYLPEQKGGTIEQKKLTNRVQRTCINVEVAIDRRIPPDYIPSGLLKGISDVLTTIIETIDKVVKPIETIGKYLFYACVASTFLSFVPIFLEKYNCEYRKFEQMVGGQGKFVPAVAEIGACDAEYAGKEESRNNCNTCQQWKNNRKKFDRTYHQICDRVMCPSAPSLQYYLKTKGRQKTTIVNAPTAQAKLTAYTKETDGLLAGSDCAAWAKKKQTEAQTAADKEAKPGQPKLLVRPSRFFTTQQIEDIYKNWLKHQDDTPQEGEAGTGTVNCAGLHPATPECCGYEYMQEWSSACGVSALGNGLDTFDEIKESTCLAEQKANKNELPGLGTGEKVQCNKLLNSVSGFCDKDGQPTPETFQVVPFQGSVGEKGTATGKLADLGLGTSKDRWMYLLMEPQQNAKEYDIKLGYIVETVEFKQTGKDKDVRDEQRHEVNSKIEGIDLQETSPSMQEKYFKQTDLDKYYQNQLTPDFYKNFQEYLCQQAGYDNGKCNANGRDVYKRVAEKMGTPDKEYIIKPNEGLINSIRCLCFPTLLGYLRLWRKIMIEVRNCVNTILLTGDGESGVCQAIISKYVCDLLYEVLACFTQKFGSPGGGGRAEGPGDIMGALTSAGTEMSRSVESRYGETGMYKAVFVDQKLVHSICMFAFTGTWDFDLAAMYDKAVDNIPIDSQALMMPCNRRFSMFIPSTRPPGLITWVYHFGVFVAAGADIDVELHLVCSGGFKCKESDGFENGKCDCVAPRDIVILPQEIPTRIKKNQILNQEVFFTMAAGPPESQIRYDKAYLQYTYKSGNKIEPPKKTDPCSIGLTGGTGSVPPICRFDLLGQSFRCSFGEAEGAIRFSGATPVYPHKIPTEVYAVKDNLNVELKIQQDYTAGEANAKHLQYEVLNPAGQVVQTNKDRGLFMLTTTGDYTKRIGPADTQDPITVKKEWFGAGTGAGQAQVSELFISKNGVNPALRPVVERNVLKIVEQGVQTTGQYILILSMQGGSQVYAVYKGTTPSPTSTGFAKQGSPICSGPTPPPNSEIPCQDGAKTITIRLTDVRPTDKSESYEAYIGFGQIAGTSPCEGAARLLAQPFKIKFTAFDSDKYGQPTEQVTLDPLTGQDGIVEVPLNIVCANNDDTDFKTLDEKYGKGIIQPTEIITGLDKLLTDMIAKENNHKKQMEGFAKEANLVAINTQIRGYFDTIIYDEPQWAARLGDYLKNLEKSNLQQLYVLVRELHYTLRDPPQAELEDPEMVGIYRDNVVRFARAGKEEIEKQTGQSTTPDNEKIRKSVQDFIPYLDGAVKKKEEILKLIPTLVKIAPADCPVPGKTEPDGAFYTCSETALPAPTWAEETSRACRTTTTQKCYKLPKDNNCAGLTTGDTNFNCQPQQPGCTGGFTPYTADPAKGEKARVCPQTGQVCCRKTITGLEKLLGLKKIILDMQRLENGAAGSLKTELLRNDERLLEQMIPHSEQAPLIQKITGIIGMETGAQRNLQSTFDTYTVEKVEIPFEVYDIINGAEEAGIPGIPEVVLALQQIKKELLSSTKPAPYFIRAKVSEAQETIKVLDWLKRGAIQGINEELGVGTCQASYISTGTGEAVALVDGVPIYEDKLIEVQICAATNPGELWKEVKNAPCPGFGEKCYTGQPRIYYKTGTASPKELVTTNVKFQKGEQVTFTAKIPVIQTTDVPSPQLKLGDKTITAQQTSGPNYVQIESTQEVESPTSVSLNYEVQGKKGETSGYFNIACPVGKSEDKEYSCNEMCDESEEWPPYECATAGQSCCLKTIAAPSTPTKKTITYPAVIHRWLTGTPGCAKLGDVEYVSQDVRFTEDGNNWAFVYPEVGTAKKANEWAQLCVAKDLVDLYKGDSPVQLVGSTSHTDDVCPAGKMKGWFTNSFSGWAVAKGIPLRSLIYYLNLCVKNDAIAKFGDDSHPFVYLGVKTYAGTERQCLPGYNFGGYFQFSSDETNDFFGAFLRNGDSIAWDTYTSTGTFTKERWFGLCVKPIEITTGTSTQPTSKGLFGGLSAGTKITLTQGDNFVKNVGKGRIYSSAETPAPPFYVIKLLPPSDLDAAVCTDTQKRVKVQVSYNYKLCKEADLGVDQQITISQSDCGANSDPGTLELTRCEDDPRLWEFTVK